jgi:hypothetical protein
MAKHNRTSLAIGLIFPANWQIFIQPPGLSMSMLGAGTDS